MKQTTATSNPMKVVITAKARLSFRSIVVDDCPFCHSTHYHNFPISEGTRMADCFNGEYLLEFELQDKEQSNSEKIP